MFTGIIQYLGRIEALEPVGSGRRIRVGAPFRREIEVGESIAVNGVCLTALKPQRERFEADVSPETLDRTNLGKLHTGDRVNLETAVTPSQPLGGHIVSGHVDGVGTLTVDEPRGDYRYLRVAIDPSLARYCIEKGSIAIDGISLTVNEAGSDFFSVMIIPHTAEATNLSIRKPGDRVNLETDIIGKYVERLLGGFQPSAGVTWEKLAEAGFMQPSSIGK